MTTNRRFPFERSKDEISLENFITTEEQLYPMIRQYASITRYNPNEKPQYIQQNIHSNQDNLQLNQLITQLKQEHDNQYVDINDFSALRQHNLQHWKHIKYQWQKYYHDQMKTQQELFDHIIKTSQ